MLSTMYRRLMDLASAAPPRQLASLAGVSIPSSGSLWDIVKREILEPHDALHITDIWTEFHSDPAKQRVAMIITATQYALFAARATESPAFVMPVFHGPGAFENFVLQCQLPRVLFTSLEDWKRHGPAAAPHFTTTYYRELAEAKGLVLVRGDITQPNALQPQQASALMQRTQEFYTDPGSYALVHAFNHTPAEFDFQRVLEALGHDGTQASA